MPIRHPPFEVVRASKTGPRNVLEKSGSRFESATTYVLQMEAAFLTQKSHNCAPASQQLEQKDYQRDYE